MGMKLAKIHRNFYLVFAVLFLSSCDTDNDLKEYYGRPGMFTLRPAHLGEMPNGDDSYSQGVRDGCNTAIAIVGTGPMADMYENTYYDTNKSIEDSDYYKGRTLGFNYCTYYQDPDPI